MKGFVRWALFVSLVAMSAQLWAQGMGKSEDRKAQKAFDAGLAAYMNQELEAALESLRYAVNRDDGFVEAWLMMGQICEDLNRPSEAADALREGLERRPRGFLRGYADWVRLLHMSGRYDEALEALEDVERNEFLLPIRWEEGELAAWHRTRESVRFAAQAYKQPVEVQARAMPGAVNTADPEYGPAITLNGLTLLFTRESRADAGHRQEDFFVSTRRAVGAPWEDAMPLVSVNTSGNEGAAAMAGDGRSFCFAACESPRYDYFGRRGKGSCDLFETRIENANGRFGLGTNLDAPNTRAWESQPSLSADGRTLLFVRSISVGPGRRHADVFFATRQGPEDDWSAAQPLRGEVNTPGDESNPMLHPDGKTLYFVSDGHPGMGGKDLFVSRLQADGRWGSPKNLGYPINTQADEGHLLVTAAGDLAYFATDRDDPGNLDLWELELPMSARPSPVVAIEGRVTDLVSGQPIEGAMVEVVSDLGELLAQVATADGLFSLPIPVGEKWWFRAHHPHYIMSIVPMSLSTWQPAKRLDIALSRLAVGSSLVLKNLRFESGSSLLSDGFQPDLDPIIEALRNQPDLRVRIVGHTDNTGNPKSNLQLSEARAQAVLEYFANAGLSRERFETEGRGQTEPLMSNDTAEGKAANRRTELIVLD